MYPLNLFSLFPPFPRNSQVFVAMSFDTKFNYRWEKVITRAVTRITFEGLKLSPYRVDAGRGSDSILTEILTRVTNCRLFFADITTVGNIKRKPEPVRNGNVMYELGLAHAVRLPEEVIIFRFDKDKLPFDVANIRVHSYEPEKNPKQAIDQVYQKLKTCLEEIDLQRSLAVKRAADFLDYSSWIILHETVVDKGLKHPWVSKKEDKLGRAERIRAIHRLLELEILGAEYTSRTVSLSPSASKPVGKEIIEYKITSFGKEVHKQIFSRLGAAKWPYY